mmetsp:Transcript_26959/g.48731  ORF Transcript_26959/g.48731 Transcript_26959/m.48731 type:complete len:240 (-) Transcript_26959:278-997(-)|eukprot:CAMPEP_0197664852 /NCGR_PEP_ID=MMETSP1338-20131121/58890_1 /TAXON_ID=43686 ORGANISM="Pelagodinium beii, Strain RCC1491" /NCGR_SAMPLE_ID=MMETSP1338 /ASSEMBLY_ACC=CAM_ASM_000754 /LENGTH=239 /DNA_ID=CAMNT_0043243575 /DNA_START=72 /DNA_END=791 /DNA_ORIENTATION=+
MRLHRPASAPNLASRSRGPAVEAAWHEKMAADMQKNKQIKDEVREILFTTLHNAAREPSASVRPGQRADRSGMKRHRYPQVRRPQSAPKAAPNSPKRCEGPERFYSDKSTYTGVHKNGGPHVLDKCGVRFYSNLSEMTRPGLRGSTYFPAKGMLPFEDAVEVAVSEAKTKELREYLEHPPRMYKFTEVNGPERFYYDKGTFTGTHRFGGPDRCPSGRHGFISPSRSFPLRENVPRFAVA